MQVTGLEEKPTLDSLMGQWVHTDPEPAGAFSCSNPLVNRIHAMIRRTQLNNLHGIPTDCPQREKLGWTQDGCVSMEEAIHNFQMATFYTKWFRDMVDTQEENGHVACIAPSPGWGKAESDGSPSVSLRSLVGRRHRPHALATLSLLRRPSNSGRGLPRDDEVSGLRRPVRAGSHHLGERRRLARSRLDRLLTADAVPGWRARQLTVITPG